MITKDYKKVEMQPEKLEKLKQVFPSFFRATSPKAVSIHLKDELFYHVLKSMRSGAIDPNRDNMQTYKQPQSQEYVQLQYRVADKDENGQYVENLWSYSTTMPTPKDALGIKFEFKQDSGNTIPIGHMTTLFPEKDKEFLYYLYYYCPLFENNECPLEKTGAEKYKFFIPDAYQLDVKNKRVTDAKNIAELNELGSANISRILKGLFQPVQDNDDANFNTLFEYLSKATPQQIEAYIELKSSSKTEQVSSYVPIQDPKGAEGDLTSVPELIEKWIEDGKLLLVSEPTEEFPTKGWYQKPAKDDFNAEDKFLKTPLKVKFIDAAQDQRLVLMEYLSNNTELFDKLKKRW